MAKYYVQSGQVRLVFDAESTAQAAVNAFQWTCDKQAGIYAESPLEVICIAEEHGWQLEDEVRISELGFDRADAEVLDTIDVVALWQGCQFPWLA